LPWKVTFFNVKVKEETLNFPKGILANFLHIAEIIEKSGPAIGKQYTAPMGKGLFEIRDQGKEGIGAPSFARSKEKKL